VYGGVSKKSQVSQLRKGVELAIACPGRLLDLVGDGDIDLLHIEVLVLDEADRMCDMGFMPDIRRIIKILPSKRQTLCFAATMPEDIRRLTDKMLRNPVRVQIGKISPAKSVSHALYPVPDKLKKDLFFAMLQQTRTGRVLVFARTKYRARNLARDLQKRGYRAAALQGNMSQNQRQRAIDGFRGHKYDVLVATDVASRGIDVSDISHVINFDIPDSADTYTHRIGRTGRVDRLGEAFTLAGSADGQMVQIIEKVLGEPIERRRLVAFNYGTFVPETQFQAKHSRSRRATPSRRRVSASQNRN
jgi:ATP-dependent RNA helicase RhlE